MSTRAVALLGALWIAAGCGAVASHTGGTLNDGGVCSGCEADGGLRDAGMSPDGSIESTDAGEQPPDAGPGVDAGVGMDAGNSMVTMGSLGAYNVNPDTVTVAGISAGAFMAVQLQVAYSASIHGAAIVAGGPYYCEQGTYPAQLAACSIGYNLPDVSTFVDYTNTQAAAGTIDPVSNISGKPIYMFSGTLDSVINQKVMNALVQYWGAFTSVTNLTYNSTTMAEHSWISPDATNSCSTLASPYLNNCGFDMEQDFLTMFYGALSPRASSPQGTYIQFDQNTFCPSGSCSSIVMDSTGWLYEPPGCSDGQACKLLVWLHGCLSDQATVGTVLVHQSGVNEWADSNNILVLYPQSSSSTADPDGCWDFTGITGANYAVKGAPQMATIMSMVSQITSGN